MLSYLLRKWWRDSSVCSQHFLYLGSLLARESCPESIPVQNRTKDWKKKWITQKNVKIFILHLRQSFVCETWKRSRNNMRTNETFTKIQKCYKVSNWRLIYCKPSTLRRAYTMVLQRTWARMPKGGVYCPWFSRNPVVKNYLFADQNNYTPNSPRTRYTCPQYPICVFPAQGLENLKDMCFNMRETGSCLKYTICAFPVQDMHAFLHALNWHMS